MLITSSGKVIRINVSDVSLVGRNTKGVKLINLDENEKVLAIAPLKETDSSEEGESDENTDSDNSDSTVVDAQEKTSTEDSQE